MWYITYFEGFDQNSPVTITYKFWRFVQNSPVTITYTFWMFFQNSPVTITYTFWRFVQNSPVTITYTFWRFVQNSPVTITYTFWRFVQNSLVFCSVAELLLVRWTWWPLFRLLNRILFIICDVLIGWSCSNNWQPVYFSQGKLLGCTEV